MTRICQDCKGKLEYCPECNGFHHVDTFYDEHLGGIVFDEEGVRV